LIGLFDRDVFLKLCCCGLFDEALAALGVTQPFRLVSTSSASSNKSIIKRKLQDFDFAPIMARIAKAVASVPTISDAVADGIRETDIYRRLTNLDDIDGGEQLLSAILLSDPRSGILISGDKRFFQAFAHALPAEWLAVRDSVISFEMCLLAIEERYGFDLIMERVYPVRACDGTLKHAFGSTPNREAFRAALISYDPCRISHDEDELV
jgi:hypothetical protein